MTIISRLIEGMTEILIELPQTDIAKLIQGEELKAETIVNDVVVQRLVIIGKFIHK